MTGKTLTTSISGKIWEKNFNVNVTSNNYLNTVNTLIFSRTTNRQKTKNVSTKAMNYQALKKVY